MAKGFKTGGRKAGTPNRITSDIRETILYAFENAGGVTYLTKVAVDHPQVFCTLLGKVLPSHANGGLNGGKTLEMLVKASYGPPKNTE
jgi:hypothetical protein